MTTTAETAPLQRALDMLSAIAAGADVRILPAQARQVLADRTNARPTNQEITDAVAALVGAMAYETTLHGGCDAAQADLSGVYDALRTTAAEAVGTAAAVVERMLGIDAPDPGPLLGAARAARQRARADMDTADARAVTP